MKSVRLITEAIQIRPLLVSKSAIERPKQFGDDAAQVFASRSQRQSSSAGDSQVVKFRDYVIYVFVEDYSGAKLVLGEGQGMCWFVPAETKHLLMNAHDRSILEEFSRSGC